MAKKKKRKKITLRHRALLKTIGENVRNGMSFGKAMREVGYSKRYSEHPEQLKSTGVWQDLMEEELKDKDLVKVLNEGLEATRKQHKIVDRDEDGKPMYDFIDIDDHPTRHKFLDTAFKIKKKYDNTIKITGKLDGVSDEEIEKRIAGILSGVISSVAREGQEREK